MASGRIVDTYVADINCPWCEMSKLRYNMEFEVLVLEQKQIIDSSYTVKGVCVHCLTVCDELPNMDFICAKCEQLTSYMEEDSGSERELFGRLFSSDSKFGNFYQRLTDEGVNLGKRYCLSCVYKIWLGYLAHPDFLSRELEKPKPEYALKKF